MRIKDYYEEEGNFNDLVEEIAILELKLYKAMEKTKEPLDGDITEEIAECFKQSLLSKLNEIEGNI